jgi:DNA-binding GntR family transcriptional regulator
MRELVRMLEDILVPRVLLIAYATRLAARRAEPDDIQRLNELSELLITAFDAKDAKVLAKGFHRWLDALVDAGHSTTIRWIANPFLQALRDLLDRLPMLWILEPSFPDHLRQVVAAVEAGDEDASERATQEYYERVDGQLLSLLRRTIAGAGDAGSR